MDAPGHGLCLDNWFESGEATTKTKQNHSMIVEPSATSWTLMAEWHNENHAGWHGGKGAIPVAIRRDEVSCQSEERPDRS